ncbi:MAG: hypothetical protein ABIA93_04515 [Candidatus Woesearchaeota archaeon]
MNTLQGMGSLLLAALATIVLLFWLPETTMVVLMVILLVGATALLIALAARTMWDVPEWSWFLAFILFLGFAALRVIDYSVIAVIVGIVALLYSVFTVFIQRRTPKIVPIPVVRGGLDTFKEKFKAEPRTSFERTSDDYLVVHLEKDIDKLQERLENLDKMMRNAQDKRNELAREKEADKMVAVVQKIARSIPAKSVKTTVARKAVKKNTKPFVRTKEGKKYHMPECFMIRKVDLKNRERITRAFARKGKLTPCGVCKPQ